MNCCDKQLIMSDPCQAILDGVLEKDNYSNFMSKGEWLLLLAQCGTANSIGDISGVLDQILACCEVSNTLLVAIDENTDGLETQLANIEVLLNAGNTDLSAILVAVQDLLVEAQDINANTDQIEALLNTIITVLNSVETDTGSIEATLTSIESDINNPTIFGTHTIDSGDHVSPPAPINYNSYLIVKTNGAGEVQVDGITLNDIGDSTSEEAKVGYDIPTPAISVSGGGEYEWRTKS